MGTATLSVSSGLLKYVAEPAARSLMLGCFAALALAVLRVRTVSLKSAVWRAVLVAALAMPFLGTFAPPIRVSVPVPKLETHAKAVAAGSAQSILIPKARTAIVSPEANAPADALDSAPIAEASPAPTRNSRRIAWPLILAGAYFAIAFLLLARVLAGAALATRLARAPSRDSASGSVVRMGRRQTCLRARTRSFSCRAARPAGAAARSDSPRGLLVQPSRVVARAASGGVSRAGQRRSGPGRRSRPDAVCGDPSQLLCRP